MTVPMYSCHVKYNCSTGNTTNYTLNTPSVMNPAPDPLRSGNIDDRIPDSSDNAQCIVKLSFKQSNGNTYTGTGFIINNHIIATCAHCLYSRTYDTFNTNYTIKVFNEAGTSVVATYSADELHIPYKYCNDHNTNYDYGLIYVDDNLSQYGQMELGLPTNNFKNTAQTVYISGFPGSVNGSGVTGRYFGAGIVLSTSNNYVINTRAYASSGDSGGPVFLEYSLSGESFRVAVGICKSIGTDAKYSSGIRMTLPVLRFLKNNANVGS